jgi:pimeloyl-ACP methyl ester carboxylesterase
MWISCTRRSRCSTSSCTDPLVNEPDPCAGAAPPRRGTDAVRAVVDLGEHRGQRLRAAEPSGPSPQPKQDRAHESTRAKQNDLAGLPIGCFGASTGAAAALVAAAARPNVVRAIVSRGGRPDLAGPALTEVRAPTLLIVGGNDLDVLELNREAFRLLRCEKRLEIVPGAGHLFEEPGALDQVARLAREWFERHLASREVDSAG